MIRFIGDYYGNRYEVSDAAGAAEHFDHISTAFLPHGERGQTIYLGRVGDAEELHRDMDLTGEAVELRVDIDVDAGRAALRWRPDPSYGVELEPAGPLAVQEVDLGGLITVPAALARVSPAMARRAAIEYVTTGRQPTGVEWVAEERWWRLGEWGLTDERGLDFVPESEDQLVHGLEEIERAARRDGNRVAALLVSQIGVEGVPYMWIVLGKGESILEFATGDDGERYACSVGPRAGEEGTVLVRHGGYDSAVFPAWAEIARDAAYAAAREFYRTKELPTCVDWRRENG